MICAVTFSAASAGRSSWLAPHPAAKAAAIDSPIARRFMDDPPHQELFLSEHVIAPKGQWPVPLKRCFSSQSRCSMVPPAEWRKPMKNTIARLAGALLALTLTTGLAAAQSKVTIAIGGGSCLCYLPTVLAKQLGEYDKAGLNVELVDLKGGSDALKAVLGGSADVVSGYFDHCVNLAAKKQELQAFVVYDRYPGLVLV